MESHQYVPLRDARDIRLLKINANDVPSRHDDSAAVEVAVELQAVSVDHIPCRYLALSYVWGDAHLREPILCNGKLRWITQNLHRALLTISRPEFLRKLAPWAEGEDVFVWTDGVCINQDDVSEKAIQIKLMREIYQKATCVVSYLGAPSVGDPRDAVLGVLSWLATQTVRDYIPIPPNIIRSAEVTEWKQSTTTDVVIRDFWCSPWFLRAWITQEVALAAEISVMFGFGAASAIWPYQTIDIISKNLFNTPLLPPAMSPKDPEDRMMILASMNQPPVWSIIKQTLKENPAGIGLARILSLTSMNKASLRKDKIYAILGLVSAVDRDAIRVDYSDAYAYEQLLSDVAMYCVKIGSTMQMLQYAGVRTESSVLPSWVPEWRLGKHNTLSMFLYKCCDRKELVARFNDRLELCVQGYSVGRVELCGPQLTFPDMTLTGEWARGATQSIQDMSAAVFVELAATALCEHAIRTHGRYPTGESVQDVVWRTLSGDQGLNNERSADEDRDAYLLYSDIISPLIFRTENVDNTEPSGNDHQENMIAGVKKDHAHILASNIPPERLHAFRTCSFLACLYTIMMGRQIIVSDSGYLGVTPGGVRRGDILVIFSGAQVPFVLRECPNGGYQVLGDCYVHGMMDGEVFAEGSDHRFDTEPAEFLLV